MNDVVEYGKYSKEEVVKHINKFYESDKNLYGSLSQTVGFYNLLLFNLPRPMFEFMRDGTILDWGCGPGIGTRMIKGLFPNAKMTGLDCSDTLVEFANNTYSVFDIEYTKETDKKFNVIINSNCLEHFSNPLDVVKSHLPHTDYYIILVPYKGRIVDEIGDHISTLDEESFPKELEDFKLIHRALIYSGPYGCWNEYQLFLIYKRNGINETVTQ